MIRKSKPQTLYPKQLLEIGQYLIGGCLIGSEPKRIAATKRLDVILASHALSFDALRPLGMPQAVVDEFERLARLSPAPEFKARPKLVAARHGKQCWAVLATVNGEAVQ
jgi:hypothetical protein